MLSMLVKFLYILIGFIPALAMDPNLNRDLDEETALAIALSLSEQESQKNDLTAYSQELDLDEELELQLAQALSLSSEQSSYLNNNNAGASSLNFNNLLTYKKYAKGLEVNLSDNYVSHINVKVIHDQLARTEKITQTLRENCQTYSDLYEAERIFFQDLEKLSNKIPLWIFKECELCPLSRFVAQQYPENFRRDYTEKNIVQYIKNNVPGHKQLVYTSMGCGDLFQDIVILYTLVKNGYKNIVINLIEKNWASFIQELPSNNKKHGFLIYRLARLIRVMNAMGAHVKVNIFSSVDAYLGACDQHEDLKSDVIIAMDVIERGVNHLKELSYLILKGLKYFGFVGSLLHHELKDTSEIYLQQFIIQKHAQHTSSEITQKISELNSCKNIFKEFTSIFKNSFIFHMHNEYRG